MRGMSTECQACGSTHKDRESYQQRNDDPTIPLELKTCPHCGSEKCCMCDMGDDVECMGCNQGDNDEG